MDLLICLFAVLILAEKSLCQDYLYIDDIPIESYDHGDHQDNEMDLELLPIRRGRSPDGDPKDYFFRFMRSFRDVDDERNFDPVQAIPRPNFPPKPKIQVNDRRRRSVNKELKADADDTDDTSISRIVKKLGKPLEVVPLDTVNLTRNPLSTESQLPRGTADEAKSKELEINDFIRFRRSPLNGANQESTAISNDQERNQPSLDPVAEKLIMDEPEDNINRESRGAKVEHWVKNIYPVMKGDEVAFNDNVPSSSDSIRAPRVRFVTQNFGENRLPASELNPYERRMRARYFDRDLREPPPALPPVDLAREMSRENPYRRRFRSYAPAAPLREPERDFYRDELYAAAYDPRSEYRDYYRPRQDGYYRTRNDYTAAPIAKPSQKRIIYYATLPEVSRSPPNVDLRDRYRFDQYRYDDRYLNDPYKYRANYPKDRYEEEPKTPYPAKVLTDVNVREVKKNPERRIYSEADRNRYAYNTPPYRAADG